MQIRSPESLNMLFPNGGRYPDSPQREYLLRRDSLIPPTVIGARRDGHGPSFSDRPHVRNTSTHSTRVTRPSRRHISVHYRPQTPSRWIWYRPRKLWLWIITMIIDKDIATDPRLRLRRDLPMLKASSSSTNVPGDTRTTTSKPRNNRPEGRKRNENRRKEDLSKPLCV
ncbi:uncharacterized protein CLUP02_01834 [Colletotrichum lupini]|uniref:Uncharacterized protein n=1 Tax=Colletotrichum lupini TaxID=145971 RepID=A0A9Q8SD38_9PEZI|nr:uncharacterized protein CLUP02_01834 [Colletotrichum lupini]UQC75181.1 hypothetical protein CLUP02_01834 [Colletotrichum lupini]